MPSLFKKIILGIVFASSFFTSQFIFAAVTDVTQPANPELTATTAKIFLSVVNLTASHSFTTTISGGSAQPKTAGPTALGPTTGSTPISWSETFDGLVPESVYAVKVTDTTANKVYNLPSFTTPAVPAVIPWWYTASFATGTSSVAGPYDTEDICKQHRDQVLASGGSAITNPSGDGVTYVNSALLVPVAFATITQCAQSATKPPAPVVITPGATNPTTGCVEGPGEYCLLQPLPQIGTKVSLTSSTDTECDAKNPDNITSLGCYMNKIIRLIIGICGMLAVLMLVIAGIQYMSTDAISGKEHAKERILNAVLGLILALGSYAILNTISSSLVRQNISISEATLQVENQLAASTFSNTPVLDNSVQFHPAGTICPGTGASNGIAAIATSYANKVSYVWGGKGGQGPVDASGNSTVAFDCTGFTDAMRQCAGAPIASGGSSAIFNNGGSGAIPLATPTSFVGTKFNGKELIPGDVLGWPTVSGAGVIGHAYMYLGGGKFIDSHGGTAPGKATAPMALPDSYRKRTTHIIPIEYCFKGGTSSNSFSPLFPYCGYKDLATCNTARDGNGYSYKTPCDWK